VKQEAADHRAKAERMLRQAESLAADQAPEAVIHLAYYAMFHAATAVLLEAGTAPALTHGGLIGGFGRLMRDRGETARLQGRVLNRAEDQRLQADYGVSLPDLADAAGGLLRDARTFVAFCAEPNP